MSIDRPLLYLSLRQKLIGEIHQEHLLEPVSFFVQKIRKAGNFEVFCVNSPNRWLEIISGVEGSFSVQVGGFQDIWLVNQQAREVASIVRGLTPGDALKIILSHEIGHLTDGRDEVNAWVSAAFILQKYYCNISLDLVKKVVCLSLQSHGIIR